MGCQCLDALIEWREILDRLIEALVGRIAASDILSMKQPVNLLIAAAILLISIGATAAQPKSGEADVQPKRIMVLHSYGQNFQSSAVSSTTSGRPCVPLVR